MTAQTLCDSFGLVCTGSNATAVSLIAAARLISVEIWGQTTTSSTASTVSVEFNNGSNFNPTYGPGTEVSDSSTSSAYTPYVMAKPPKNSNAAFWQGRTNLSGSLNATTVCYVNNSIAGGIVDVVAEVILHDNGKATPVTATVITTGTAGCLAYAPLDGIGGGVLPVGVGYFT